MKIYLAGPFNQRARLRAIRERLWEMGHLVTSSWLDEPPRPPYALRDGFETQTAIKDLMDIAAADLLIVDFLSPSTTGGRLVELGMAMARQKVCYLIMRPEDVNSPTFNIFLRLVDKRFGSWENCLRFIGRMEK